MKNDDTLETSEIRERVAAIINNFVKSKKDLAKILGVAPTTVSAWGKKRILPSIPLIIKIAVLTHTSLDYLLLGRTDNYANTINEDIFNKVFEKGYNIAKDNKLKINGSYFLGLYSLVLSEQQNNPELDIITILDNKTDFIVKFRK